MYVAHFKIPYVLFFLVMVVCVMEWWDIEVKVAIMRQLHSPVKELCTTEVEVLYSQHLVTSGLW